MSEKRSESRADVVWTKEGKSSKLKKPFRVEMDWTWEVQDADEICVAKCVHPHTADMIARVLNNVQ